MNGAKMRATAARLINANGKTVTYTAISKGVYDPAQSKVVSTETPFAMKAVVEDLGGTDTIANTLILQNEKAFTFAAASFSSVEPEINDKVTLDSSVYVVYAATPNYAGDVTVTYVIYARKA